MRDAGDQTENQIKKFFDKDQQLLFSFRTDRALSSICCEESRVTTLFVFQIKSEL
jgi:hypothetical protein